MKKNSPNPVVRKKIRGQRQKLQEIGAKRPKSPDPKWDKEWRDPIIKNINKLMKELFQIKFQMNDSEAKKAWKKIEQEARLKTDLKLLKLKLKNRKLRSRGRENIAKLYKQSLKRLKTPRKTALRTPIRLGRGKSPKRSRKKQVKFAPSVASLKQSCTIPKPKPMWSEYMDSAYPPRPGLLEPKKYTSRIKMKKTKKGMRRIFQKRCPDSEPYLKRDKGHYCCSNVPVSKSEACDFARAIKENIDAFTITDEEYEKLSKHYQKKYDSYVGNHIKGINWYLTYYCNS